MCIRQSSNTTPTQVKLQGHTLPRPREVSLVWPHTQQGEHTSSSTASPGLPHSHEDQSALLFVFVFFPPPPHLMHKTYWTGNQGVWILIHTLPVTYRLTLAMPSCSLMKRNNPHLNEPSAIHLYCSLCYAYWRNNCTCLDPQSFGELFVSSVSKDLLDSVLSHKNILQMEKINQFQIRILKLSNMKVCNYFVCSVMKQQGKYSHWKPFSCDICSSDIKGDESCSNAVRFRMDIVWRSNICNYLKQDSLPTTTGTWSH